jgi:CPA1 family monovalent cation:H+ antiporter
VERLVSLNSLVFMLIGIHMPDDRPCRRPAARLGPRHQRGGHPVRFAWGVAVWRALSGSLREAEPRLRKREMGIISWCGMRGIVSLAAALALPASLPGGGRFRIAT